MWLSGCHIVRHNYTKWWTLLPKPARNGRSSPKTRREAITVREKQCNTCKQFKPTNQFKRRLTLAQTRATLRQPNATTRFTATSNTCRSCRAQNKRRKPLTAKEIRSKITSGDMPKILGEMKLEEIRQAIPQTRSRVMKEHWGKIKSAPYRQLKRNLQDQLNRYGNRHFASKNLQDATRLQNSWNYQEAKRIMQHLLTEAQNGVDIPPLIQIASLIKPTEGEAL